MCLLYTSTSSALLAYLQIKSGSSYPALDENADEAGREGEKTSLRLQAEISGQIHVDGIERRCVILSKLRVKSKVDQTGNNKLPTDE